MRFRKLRIAWSVGWGLVAVLLIALWVRSYRVHEWITVPLPGRQVLVWITSAQGGVRLDLYGPDHQLVGWQWMGLPLDGSFEVNVNPEEGPPILRTILINVSQTTSRIFLWTRIWVTVLFAAALAGVPWLRWRFSLRSLLIATTLVAVVLGVIVHLNKAPTTPPADVGDFPTDAEQE
jgi:hypothetical protein